MLQHALELAPYDTTCLANLAAAHEALGNSLAAAECYSRLKDGYPNDWKNWRSYAAEMLLLGRWDEAEDNYRRAAELNKQAADNGKEPESAEPHYGRAAALFALGRDEEAEEEAKAATAIDPTWPETVLSLARSTMEDDRMRRSRRLSIGTDMGQARPALLNSPHPIHYDTLALCYAANGDFERAAEQCRPGLKSTPDGPWGSVLHDRMRLYQQKRVPWPE